MTELWKNLAIAAASRMEWERKCQREGLDDEAAFQRVVAEYLQATTTGRIASGYEHPTINKKRIDLVVTAPRSTDILHALEIKWVPARARITRNWASEVVREIYRLQHLSAGMRQGADRVLVLGGCSKRLQAAAIQHRLNAGGSRHPFLPALLPLGASSAPTKFQLRTAPAWIQPLLRSVAADLKVGIPSSYDAMLAGHHCADPADPHASEVYVWVTNRPKGWGSFDPAVVWGP